MLAVAKAPLAPGTSVPSVQQLSLHEVDSGVVASEVDTLHSHSSAHDITHSGTTLHNSIFTDLHILIQIERVLWVVI